MEREGGCKRMVCAFLAMEPPHLVVRLAREAGKGCLSEDVQEIFLRDCIHNTVCEIYPPSQQYIAKVLKQIILAAESESVEVISNLYQCYATILSTISKEYGDTQKCYRSYLFCFPDHIMSNLMSCLGEKKASRLRNMMITIRVSTNILEGDTGCSVWPASLFLSEFILTNPQLFSNKCCVELGCGSGLSTICLARLNCCKVIATDGNPTTLLNFEHNLNINKIPFSKVSNVTSNDQSQCVPMVELRELVWESVSDNELASCDAQIVLGADVVYDSASIPHLVRTLVGMLSKKSVVENQFVAESPGIAFEAFPHPVVYLATVVRNPETMTLFFSLANKAGLDVQDVTNSMKTAPSFPIMSYDRSLVRLHRLNLLGSNASFI